MIIWTIEWSRHAQLLDCRSRFWIRHAAAVIVSRRCPWGIHETPPSKPVHVTRYPLLGMYLCSRNKTRRHHVWLNFAAILCTLRPRIPEFITNTALPLFQDSDPPFSSVCKVSNSSKHVVKLETKFINYMSIMNAVNNIELIIHNEVSEKLNLL